MLVEYGGRVCTISSSEYQDVFDDNKFPDDGYLYRIKEDNSTWSWASSMFEPEF